MKKQLSVAVCAAALLATFNFAAAQDSAGNSVPNAQPLPPPGFHHLMLNTPNVDAALAYYTKAFPKGHRQDWEGYPGYFNQGILLLFNKVSRPADSNPMTTAFWHFGFDGKPQRQTFLAMKAAGFKFVPAWTGIDDQFVETEGDALPGKGGIYGQGQTKAQLAESIAKGDKPPMGDGFSYLAAPDGAMIEMARDNHIHMWEEEPFCAQFWYQKHLEGGGRPPRVPEGGGAPITETNCHVDRGELTWPSLEKSGMYRWPVAGVTFGGVSMNWYKNQTEKPLVSTKGHLMDNVGFSVTDLDAWVKKLKAENVHFLREPYKIGNSRVADIEGPSHEVLELVEVK